MKTLTNLRVILEYFEIPNRDIAQAINISPSMVSNWVQGKRALRMSSGFVVAIADYILSKRTLTLRDITWLKKRFQKDAIPVEFDTASDIKRSLVIWLADDGQDVLEVLKKPEDNGITQEKNDELPSSSYLYSIGPAGRIYSNDYSARAGIVDISMRLGRIFATIEQEAIVDICLSSEAASTIVEDLFVAEMIKAFREKNMRLRMLVALSSNSFAVSRIIKAYSQMIVHGNLELYISHGMMQPMIHQTSIFIPKTCAVAITELPDSFSPPAALFITENEFLKDAADGFDRIVRFTQPLMQFFADNNTKGIVDLFRREFCDEGDIDILSDGINPLMLEKEAYVKILQQKGFKGNALEWRCDEYHRIKDGFENNLRSGAVFREIISCDFLKTMAVNHGCELPSMYFMDTGKTHIDAESCKALLRGYIAKLNTFPNYHLLIAQPLSDDQQGTRHIKHGRHITLNPWKSTQPMVIYSDQMIMIQEYQTSFNELWTSLSMGTRENTTAVLETLAQEM